MGGNFFVDAGGREVLQNEAAIFFHNSRAKVFIAGYDDEVILVSKPPLKGFTLVPDEIASRPDRREKRE
jgi:hypothetical protein